MKTIIGLKENNVYVNGVLISQLPFGNSDIFIKKTSDIFYSLQGLGFRVLYDGIRAYITLDPLFIDNTRGLCGTYNFKSDDDFLPPDGFTETNVTAFADDYATELCGEEPDQTPPCETFIIVNLFFVTQYLKITIKP